ncbi:hypothetical protein FNE34_00310 [Helicobacter pylori]|nr:hypothetical protein FNE44_00310 [Helicobacter pylori]WRG02742.1 hypothetical protein FNE34_00310 [Helicobacter pylori]
MMIKNAYAFVVIEKSIMVFKCAKDKGLIPITEGFAPLKEGFLKSFKERCNVEFLENLDLLFFCFCMTASFQARFFPCVKI